MHNYICTHTLISWHNYMCTHTLAGWHNYMCTHTLVGWHICMCTHTFVGWHNYMCTHTCTLVGWHNYMCTHTKLIQVIRTRFTAGKSIWATSWQTNKMACASSEDSDQLGMCPVWSESLLYAWRKLGSLATHWAHSEDSYQTGQMPRLISVFAGRTCHFVVFVMRWLILCCLKLSLYIQVVRR